MNYEDFVKTFSQHSVMTIAELASKYQVSPRTIGRWKKRYHDEQNAQPEKSDENPFAGVPGIVPVDRQYPKLEQLNEDKQDNDSTHLNGIVPVSYMVCMNTLWNKGGYSVVIYSTYGDKDNNFTRFEIVQSDDTRYHDLMAHRRGESVIEDMSDYVRPYDYQYADDGIYVIETLWGNKANIKLIPKGGEEFDTIWDTTRDGTFFNIDWSYLFKEEHIPTEDNRYEYVLIPGEVTIYKINSAGIVPRVFKSDSREFSKILAKITQGDDDFMEFFVDALVEQVNIVTDNRVKITNSNISVDGFDLSNELSNEILSRLSTGGLESVGSLIKFLDNLVANPDSRVFDQLYSFIKHNDIEIDEDGNIVAYKRVRSDYKDVHSGTMDNHPGTVVTMPRFKVNNNPEQTCAPGLHVCAASYLPHFGGERIVRVKINPKNVVSIPTDYNGAKMRVCEYVVIDDVTEDMS